MFSPRLLFAVFCFCLTLRLSLSSPAPESREVALSAIFDYLEKRVNDDEAELDSAVAEAENDLREEAEADLGEVGPAEKRELETPIRRGQSAFIFPVMAATKLTSEQIKLLLDMHNKERSLTYGNDEMLMTWDDDLAKLSQGLSDSCLWAHDNMNLPNGDRVGQNIARGGNPKKLRNYRRLVNLWINEKKDYNIKTGACAPGKVCGHYTQVVWHSSNKVGCGATNCPGKGLYLVCDYSPPGNWRGEMAVNRGGMPCSKCNLYPGTACPDGLCAVCDPQKDKDCRPYDGSQCIDAKLDPNVGGRRCGEGCCDWVKKHCNKPRYKKWLEGSCAKTCGFCRS